MCVEAAEGTEVSTTASARTQECGTPSEAEWTKVCAGECTKLTSVFAKTSMTCLYSTILAHKLEICREGV